MPELPDITVYVEALRNRIVGERLARVIIKNPFFLRTAMPPIVACQRKRVVAIERIGKRIGLGLEDELWMVLHLMIAGRLHWLDRADTSGKGATLAEFKFTSGALTLTEAGSKRRASLHVVQGAHELKQFDRGGLEVMSATEDEFDARLRMENHTLKRALTDPRLLHGIGNAYSDEILHAAKLSPMALTQRLTGVEMRRLFAMTQQVLREWTNKLRTDAGGDFPEKVTAFRKDMAVHGCYGQPCPECGIAVQRIRYAANETNYCPCCQTEGRVLADRSLSRLLKDDWPKSVEELEKLRP